MGRFGFALMSFLIVAFVAVAQMPLVAQDAGDRTQRSERSDRGDRQRGNFDREAMIQRMSEMMKQRLDASDEEWEVIQPRLMKVQQLERENRAGFGRAFGRFGNRSRGGDDDRGARQGGDEGGDRELSVVAQKSQALRQVLENENADTEAIKSALEELRVARKAHEAEVEQARQELREVLTLRQEAVLVAMGTLE